jgi:hypothetical protein
MIVLGILLAVVDDLPGSGVASGVSLAISGMLILGTLYWSVRRRQTTRRADRRGTAGR